MKALAIVGVLLGVLLLFALCLLFRAFDDPRTLAVDLSQAVIELVGLAALGFAIYEFRASQQKPKLELWGLSKQEASDRRFFEKSAVYAPQSASNKGLVTLSGNFSLHFINFGFVPAQSIKVTLRLPDTDWHKLEVVNPEGLTWTEATLGDRRFLSGHGEGTFVVHSIQASDIPEYVDRPIAQTLGEAIGTFYFVANVSAEKANNGTLGIEATFQCLGGPLTKTTIKVLSLP